MLQISVVVFREILEIALILGILIAATKEISGRKKWIFGGLIGGIFSSIFLAFSADKISESLNGVGQEFFNGLILISAAFLISWTVLWMQKHAKSISGELKKLGNSVREGKKPLYALAVVIFLSVLREGVEIVLFTYSYYLAQTALSEIAFGLLFGLLAGSLVGLALYLGLIKTAGKYFFIVTTWLLVFLSCGIASQGIGFWTSAEIIPSLANPAIDLSEILPQQSFLGKILNMFFGYIDQPNGMQLIVYFFVLSGLICGLKIAKRI